MEAIRMVFAPQWEDLLFALGGYVVLCIPLGVYLMVQKLRNLRGGNQ